jgi:hypothetical protein
MPAMPRVRQPVRKAAIAIWLLLCMLITGVAALEALDLDRHVPQRFGRWSCGLGGDWAGKVSVFICRDDPVPNVGPPLDPGLKYNGAVLAWYYKLPVAVYHSRWGFDRDVDPRFQVNPITRRMSLVGTTYVLRMPDWAAAAMWLPFLSAWGRRRHRRRMVRTGHCGQCFYDLTANKSGVCPECGTPLAATAAVALTPAAARGAGPPATTARG